MPDKIESGEKLISEIYQFLEKFDLWRIPDPFFVSGSGPKIGKNDSPRSVIF